MKRRKNQLSMRYDDDQTLTRSQSCQRGTLRFDLYKQPFRMLLPDQKDEYRTFIGAVLTISSIITVLVFATFKIDTLVNYIDYKVQIRTFEEYYDYRDRIDSSSGFMIAAGIPAKGATSAGDPIPPDIGALKFYR